MESLTNPHKGGTISRPDDSWSSPYSGEIGDNGDATTLGCGNQTAYPQRPVAIDISNTMNVQPFASNISGPNGSCIFARQTSLFQYATGAGYVWQAASNADNYSAAWYAIPNMPASVRATGNVASTSWAPNRIDLLVLNGTNNLYHSEWNGSAWGWEPMTLPDPGCTFLKNPDITSTRPGALTIAVTCHKSNGQYHVYVANYSTLVGWGTWQDLASSSSGFSKPAITSMGSFGSSTTDRLDLFVLRGDGYMMHTSSNYSGAAGTWTALDSRGYPPNALMVGDPDAAAWGWNRLDVVISSFDGRVQHLNWDGSNWFWDSGGLNGQPNPSGVSFIAGPSITGLGDSRIWVSAVDTTGGVWNAKYDFGWNSWFHTPFGTSEAGIESTSW